ncbi:MAG: CcmD family protein [Candidatus Kapabacteria bacterium]|nr:CcmD family protein [Candidatus Kapabacteria bacterium]
MIQFMTDHAAYVVLATVLVVWFGIAGYLQRIDNRLRELERGDER